jgi:hypothetical protein
MMFTLFVGGVAAVIAIAVVFRTRRQCWRCVAGAVSALICAIVLANAAYTAYLNIDGASAARTYAIVLAVCNPEQSSSLDTRDVSCGATDTAYGVDIDLSSERVMTADEQQEVVVRIKALKPILTTRRVHVRFPQRRSASSVVAGGGSSAQARYSYETYGSVDL